MENNHTNTPGAVSKYKATDFNRRATLAFAAGSQDTGQGEHNFQEGVGSAAPIQIGRLLIGAGQGGEEVQQV